MVQVKNKVCLIVHDGWGIAPEKHMKGDAIDAGDTTNMDTISKDHSVRTLAAHGLAVGLSDGLMGNSEVGHLNIGAGRIVWQDIVRIDVSIKKRQFHKNEAILESFNRAKDGNGRLHLLGLVSDGGVHSHITHLYALLETAKEVGLKDVYIHFFGDGRDTAPRSAAGYMKDLLAFIEKEKIGEVATVVGRYYAMDRDKRWERIKIAVDGLVKGEGEKAEDPVKAIEERYKKDETDEFLKPIIVDGDAGRIKDGDTLFFFNYRSDRMREIVSVFGLPDKPMEVDVPKDLHITTMSRYNVDFPFNVAFPPQAMTNVLAEWLAKQGVKQAHVAETEKYAHVTFFFNGGVEKQFDNEERHMIPSPKVATYDKDPKMSVHGVAERVAELVRKGEHEFVMCNFAPPDMVGHTGVYDAAVEAISHTDKAVGVVYKACQDAGYILLITADHGNAEQMINPETGAPHTAHTTNPVPFIMTGDPKTLTFAEDKKDGEEEEGALCDVAPTVLDIMGLPKPEEMTGRSLLAKA
ncbi:cofactor-independent phosphoglycerate mutase [Trametes coccinea BRFM310]|uniref:2,3-bisphosphoglycerate-independent phosphoglycerate mutase n=1 Tax=Trametes coccinea (strain BRFM310) TaxID=1353009 RepID=A0A1Y2ILN1_TRAC3|nr:cofactor-independent phosphoglycerate mutase [Trametes coccinea BRFM310]